MDEHEISSYHSNNGVVRNFAHKRLWTELAVGPQRFESACRRPDESKIWLFPFGPADKRIQFVGGDTKWLVLDSLMHKSQEFHDELAREKKRKSSNPKPKRANKKRKMEPWWSLVCKGIEMLLGRNTPENKSGEADIQKEGLGNTNRV